jgi:alpha-glucosidase (family GH31 glycosyl hydrolase)
MLATLCSKSFSVAVGNYSSHTQTGNQIDITVSNGKVRVYVCKPNIMRVSWDAQGTFTSTQDVLGMPDLNRTDWAAVNPTVTDGANALEISTSALKMSIAKNPFRISYYKAGGTTPLLADAAAMNDAGASASSPAFTFTQSESEHFFGWGLGFQWFRVADAGFYFSLDNKGQTYSKRRQTADYMYSTDGYGLFFLFAEPYPSSSAWGSISNGDPAAGFNLKDNTQKYWMSPSVVMDYASYYFILGDWKTAMSGYTEVAGRPPRLGKKFYGIMRDMYFRSGTTVNTMKSWADMFRQNRFNMDWVRMDNFFDWTNLGYLPNVPNSGCWNSSVEAAVKYYKDKGFSFGGMSAGWGFYGCCSAGCTQNKLETVSVCKTAIDHGFDWAWYDAMNFQGRKQAKEQWNTWVEAHGGDETKVMVSRGWQALSSQSWPGNHMGDYLNQEYNAYRKFGSFTSALAEALVGYAYSHCDLGEKYDFGYMSFALRPMYTIHMAGGAGGDAQDFEECGRIGSYTAAMKGIMNKWDNIHYRFIPYLFTYGMIAHETGIPVWRGMMCQNGGEQIPATYPLYMQCYVGEELIVSPYFNDCKEDGGGPSYANNKETRNGDGNRHNIYIPSGVWYDFFPAGAPAIKYTGPTTIPTYNVNQNGTVETKRLPLFVKANSIIPWMDSLQYIGEKPESEITLMCWPSDGTTRSPQEGSFVLYEDETPVKTSFAMTYFPETQTTRIQIGAFAGSKYCATAASRKYRVQAYGLGATAPTEVTSGATRWTTPITKAQIDSWTPGFYHDGNTQGGITYVNADGAAQNQAFTIFIGPVNNSVRPTELSNILARKVLITRDNGALTVDVPFNGNHVVELLSAQGKVITRRTGSNAAQYRIMPDRHTPALYLVRVKADGRKPVVQKMML